MSWRDKNPVKRIIVEANGNKDQIERAVADATEKNPFFPLEHKASREYLQHDQTREALLKVLSHERPEKYLQHMNFFRQHLQDEELQDHIIKVHAQQPWQFYIHGEQLKELFPSHYFKELLKQDKDFLADPNLGPIFLLYFSNNQLSAWKPVFQEYLKQSIESPAIAEIRILDHKDAGFACGGMEKNYRQAALHDTGLCKVNGGLLLAKLYHAKQSVDAKKVAYICRDTQETSSGQILWSNYLYAPAEGQHQLLIDAISNGQKNIQIDDLKVKPIRPLIAETSKAIYSLLREDQSTSEP